MSVPRWWELAQFISKKCDSVCTDWMKVVDCIVLSGAHLLAVGNHDHHHGQQVSPHMYVRMYVCTYVRIRHLTLHTYVCIVRLLTFTQ